MKILILAPHPDDEAIGCGGALCLHAEAGDTLAAVFLTSGEAGMKHLPREEAWRIREDEARTAGRILGIKNLHFMRGTDWGQANEIETAAARLTPIMRQLDPDLIYLPHANEWHPDHQAALPILKRALQSAELAGPKLRGYEIWTPIAQFTHVEKISDVIGRKLLAIRAHRSQLQQLAYDRAVLGLNRYRGILAGQCQYAEVFVDIKL